MGGKATNLAVLRLLETALLVDLRIEHSRLSDGRITDDERALDQVRVPGGVPGHDQRERDRLDRRAYLDNRAALLD